MTPRERFRRVMACEPVECLPVLAFEPYEASAIERWHAEGLPEGAEVTRFLGLSRLVSVPVNLGPIPAFEHRVLFEDDTHIVETTDLGATVKRRKENPTLFYGHIDHPVKSRSDWEDYRRHFDASTPGRLPADWDESTVPALNASEDPVGLCVFPFFFRLGFYSMGMERFLTLFHEDPALMHDIFAHWSAFVAESIRPVLEGVPLDFVMFAEDLAGKNGPLISPGTYEEFWRPHQGPIIRMIQDHGIPVICQWTAGEFEALVPTLIDHGFNATWPLEVVAGMDASAVRRRFGRGLGLAGNIAKEAVIAGPEAIDGELERLMPLIREGGFIPALDDMASPDMPFASYRYLIERLQSIRL